MGLQTIGNLCPRCARDIHCHVHHVDLDPGRRGQQAQSAAHSIEDRAQALPDKMATPSLQEEIDIEEIDIEIEVTGGGEWAGALPRPVEPLLALQGTCGIFVGGSISPLPRAIAGEEESCNNESDTLWCPKALPVEKKGLAPTDVNPAMAPLETNLEAWTSILGLGLAFGGLDKNSGPWTSKWGLD